MYRPRCWEAILFLATTSYLFSKTYPSPGEELRGKENAGLDVWFWLLFVPDTPTPEKNRGAQTGFENTLLRIREAIHSLVETVGQDTHEEREKCLNVWCLHELLEVRGYCIGRLHFLWMMKPKGAGRVSHIDRGLPFLPPPSPWSQDEVAEEAVNHAAGSERPNNNSSSVSVFCYSPSERLDGGVRRDAARTRAPRPLLLNQRTYLLIRALTSTGRALTVFLNSWMMTRRKQLFAARSSVSL